MTSQIHKSILIKETIDQFGYDPNCLKNASEKLVIKKFGCCGIIEPRKFRAAMRQHKCKSCSNKDNASLLSGRLSRSNIMKLKQEDPTYIHPTKGIGHSETTKKKLSDWRTGKTYEEIHGVDKARLLRAKISKRTQGSNNPFYGKHHKEESLRRGKDNLQYGKIPNHTNKVWYERLDGKKICFRSSWEAKTAKYLDNQNIEWEYEHKTFDLGSSTYLPDFWLPKLKKYIEVKGRWWPCYKEKFQMFKDKYPKIVVELWQRTELIKQGIL